MRLELPQCVIRPWGRGDAAALALAANNRNVWLGSRDLRPHPYSRADAEA